MVCLSLRRLGHWYLVSLLGSLRLLTTKRLGEKRSRKGSRETEEKWLREGDKEEAYLVGLRE